MENKNKAKLVKPLPETWAKLKEIRKRLGVKTLGEALDHCISLAYVTVSLQNQEPKNDVQANSSGN